MVGMADQNRSWYHQDLLPLRDVIQQTYGLPRGNITDLQNPTKEQVLDSFKFDDVPETLIFYYTGHGSFSNGAFSFCTRHNYLSDSEVSEAIAKCGPSKIFIVIDACHAGGFDVKDDVEQCLPSLSAGHGTAVLAACVAEKTTPGSSPLTTALCKVLTATAKQVLSPSVITNYVKREMSDAVLLTGAEFQPFSLSPGMTVVASCRNARCLEKMKPHAALSERYGEFSITTLEIPECASCRSPLRTEYLHFDSCHWQVKHAYVEGGKVVRKSTNVMQSSSLNHWSLEREALQGYRYLDVTVTA